MKKSIRTMAVAGLVAGVSLGAVLSAGAAEYEVTVTNATSGQPFAPNLVIVHDDYFSLFTPGSAPTNELAELAETGSPAGLIGTLGAGQNFVVIPDPAVVDPPLTVPGQSRTDTITSDGGYISVAAMLIGTNDGFYAVRNVKLPESGSITVYAPVYDAGSEENNEKSGDVPLTNLGNSKDAGANAGDGEGFIHIHPGIYGVGQLRPADHNWNNPAAAITITKVAD